MKTFSAKILFILLIAIVFLSCSITKNIEQEDHLLKENLFQIDGEEVKNPFIKRLVLQKPNSKLAGIPLRLHFYNLANKNPDSTFTNWLNRKPKRKDRLYKFLSKKQTDRLQFSYVRLNEWLRNSGEPPSIIDSTEINASIENILKFYEQNGWREAQIEYDIKYGEKQSASTTYKVTTGPAYTIDSVTYEIQSPVVDSIYTPYKPNSFIRIGKKYSDNTLLNERDRIANIMRNSGLYTFEKDNMRAKATYDSINKSYWIEFFIKNKKITDHDSVWYEPYKVYKISEVNVFTDFAYNKKDKPVTNTTIYKNYNFFSFGKQRYKPKALADAIFIKPGDVYKDNSKILTLNQLNNLKTFKYPNIKYVLDERDSTNTSLIANVLLSPLKRFSLSNILEFSHNNVQNAGIAFSSSVMARNIFKGAENLQLSLRGSIGSSKDLSSDDEFFDIREIGADLKLSFPRFFFPINTSKWIPKTMSPTTRFSVGASSQTNIGLDKTKVTGVLNYGWIPKSTTTCRFDLLSAQFVRNQNPSRYFEVYQSAYNRLNTIATDINYTADGLSIPDGTNQFLFDVLTDNLNPTVAAQLSETDKQTIRNINERKGRLTENNLILSSNFSFVKNTQKGLLDKQYTRFGFKLELGGNSLATLSNMLGLKKNSDDRYELFNVAYSQYVKTELDLRKYWDLNYGNIIALKGYFGLAIPYGNSDFIPFTKSFFAGGSNDNRAWEAYKLGPGSSLDVNEFNEANMKIAFNGEFRFDILGDFKGALFTDVGNIWNVLDGENQEELKFSSFSDLKELAVGSGFGLRYDFNLFILRFDTGFKTYEPYLNNKKWLQNYNFKKAVYNVGINYPF